MTNKYSDLLALKKQANEMEDSLTKELTPFFEEFKNNIKWYCDYVTRVKGKKEVSWKYLHIGDILFKEDCILAEFFDPYDDDYWRKEGEFVDFPLDILNNHSKEKAIELAKEYSEKLQAKYEAEEKAYEDRYRKEKLAEFNRLKQELGQ